jgi:hypothetical protein
VREGGRVREGGGGRGALEKVIEYVTSLTSP